MERLNYTNNFSHLVGSFSSRFSSFHFSKIYIRIINQRQRKSKSLNRLLDQRIHHRCSDNHIPYLYNIGYTRKWSIYGNLEMIFLCVSALMHYIV